MYQIILRRSHAILEQYVNVSKEAYQPRDDVYCSPRTEMIMLLDIGHFDLSMAPGIGECGFPKCLREIALGNSTVSSLV